ncbi:response regulator transcription factor [Mobiluncus mulieris]|uniref:response regulator transcription factor n=1 Tax=Mobiluncus mulieris TaxID=2052 RepID=UPI000D84DEA2|nr:response regulator transcription factor [Mobiluncus mulieris]SPX75825.1 Response regulator protein vraR [Mobiluncus mulieris]
MVSTPMIEILIVDDDAEYSSQLATLLSHSSEIRIVGIADSGESALELIPQLQPDIVLLDIDMPGIGGLATLQLIVQNFDNVQPVILSAFPHPENVERALGAGARGFLVKGSTMQDLVTQLRTVVQGKIPIDSEPEQVLISNVSKKIQVRDSFPEFAQGVSGLPERFRPLLPYLARGKSDKAISRELHLSVKTIRNYVTEILEVTACESRTEFAFKALSTGLVEVSPDLL